MLVPDEQKPIMKIKNNNFTFRYTPEQEDCKKIRDIVFKTGFFSDEESDVAVELVEEKLRLGPKSTYQFIFTERDGTLLGYSCYGHIPLTQESYDLYWIAVDPDCQGGGIGKKLLYETEKSIKKLSGVHLYIETASRKQYDPTRKFYLACGYKKAAFFKDFYSPGDGKTVFYKKLK